MKVSIQSKMLNTKFPTGEIGCYESVGYIEKVEGQLIGKNLGSC